MSPPNKDTFVLRDANGNIRVKIGSLEGKTDMDYMYHFTRDGEYVDGVPVSLKQIGDSTLLGQLAATYQGCHAWVYLSSAKGEWVQIVAVALPYERWRGELTHMVPECVRTAEYVRDKS